MNWKTSFTFIFLAYLIFACQSSSPSVPSEPHKTPTSPIDTPIDIKGPTPVTFTFTASVSPEEAGFIYPPNGHYNKDAELSVKIRSAPGYVLDHWSGDASGDATELSLVMDADKKVTAHFRRISLLVQFDVDFSYYMPNPFGNILIDFDSDGDQDLILNQRDDSPPQDPLPVLAYRNDGSGQFTEVTQEVFAGFPAETTGTRAWVVEDFNADGRMDLFIADQGPNHEPFPGGQSLLFIQTPSGQLLDETSKRLPLQLAYTQDVAAGDIDNDGDVDLYLSNLEGAPNLGPRFYLNDGAGYFKEDTSRIPWSIATQRKRYSACHLADIDNDDDLDLILGAIANSPATLPFDGLLLNDGTGFFQEAPQGAMPPRFGGHVKYTDAIASADLDQDGWEDLVMSTHLQYTYDAKLQLLMNNGDGTFRDETTRIIQDWLAYRMPDCGGEQTGWLNQLFLEDANGDGWVDLLVQSSGCAAHLLFENVRGEQFDVVENLSEIQPPHEKFPSALFPGDVDDDGTIDVLLLYTGREQQIYLRITSDPPVPIGDVAVIPVDIPVFQEDETSCPSEAHLSEAVPLSPPLFRDDFEGTLESDWSWIREDASNWSLSDRPGFLRLKLQSGWYFRNMLLRQAPEGNFEISTHLFFTPSSNFQFAGLIVYQDDEDHLKLGRAYCNTPNTCVGNGIYFDNIIMGERRCSNFSTRTSNLSEAHLKIRREGVIYLAFYSEDGESWSLIGQHKTDMENARIGLLAGQTSYPNVVDFDEFLIHELQ